MDYNVFRAKVLSLLKEQNKSQYDLAAYCGLTQATLSRNINGVCKPKLETIESIAKFFGTSRDYLMSDNYAKDVKKEASVSIPDDKVAKFALYDAGEGLSQDQVNDVLKYIEFIKQRGK